MKTILFAIIILTNSLVVFGQGQLVSISGSYLFHANAVGSTSFSYYYFTRSINGVISSNNITFNLANFNNGTTIHFIFGDIVNTSNAVQSSNLTVSNNQVSVPISILSSGIYKVTLIDNNGNSIPYDKYLLIENIETYDYASDASIKNMPLKFNVHYNDNYFPNSLGTSYSTIKGYIKEGWKKSWIKENNDWNLCQGLPNNTIPDNDNNFDIHLFDNSSIQYQINAKYIYHGYAVTGYLVQKDGFMYLNSDMNFLNESDPNDLSKPYNPLNLSSTDEFSFITEVISHEMLHGIQNSWVPIANETNLDDRKKRKWQREGQARFLETVIMAESNFLYNGKNISMLNNSFKTGGLYEDDTHSYMDSILRIKIPPKLQHVSYQYALFWRHLFEHNFSTTTPVSTKMALLRETMKTNTTALLPDIKSKMDVALSSANGNFHTFEDAIKDFTRRVFFYHKDWTDVSGNKFNNWEDPNNCNFYESLAQNIVDVPHLLLNYCFSGNFDIKSSYGFVPHQFSFLGNGKFIFNFNSDPDGDGKMARFYVKSYLTEKKKIKSETECVLTSGKGSINLEITNYKDENFVVIITRLDLDEDKNNNYNLNIIPEPVQADFEATPSAGNEYYKISFADKSKGYPTQWQWNFGEGTTASSELYDLTYSKSGSYNVSLTVTNCMGSTSTKTINNYVNLLPPFLEKVEILGGISSTSSKFKRTYDNTTGTYSSNNTPVKIESGDDLSIYVRSTAPLQKLKLQILRSDNKDATGYVDEQNSTGNTQRDWIFHVPKSSFSRGFSNIWFTGTDYSGKDLLKDAVPIDRAVVISTTGYTSPDLSQITGTDKNYYMYINPWLGIGTRNMDIVVDKTDCTNSQTTIFVYSNYDKGLSTIDFGDGITIPILPNNMLKHTYNTSTTKTFTIKMIKDGSVISSKTMKF